LSKQASHLLGIVKLIFVAIDVFIKSIFIINFLGSNSKKIILTRFLLPNRPKLLNL